MRSEYRQWTDEMKVTFPIAGGQGHVMYSVIAGQRVENDDGSWTPKQFTYVEFPSKKELPYFVMECDHSEDLVPQIVAFQVIQQDSSRDVQSTDLRRVRLEDALELAWTKVTHWPVVVSGEGVSAQDVKAQLGQTASRKVLRGLRAQGRRKITESIHREVARVYREHLDTGAPTKAVADHFALQPSTASLYVKRARAAGALEPRPVSSKSKKPSAAGSRSSTRSKGN